jgi:hypothetical protein
VPRSSTTSVGELQAIVPSFHRHLRAANRSAAAMAAYVATEEAFAAFLAGRGMPTDGRIGPEGAHEAYSRTCLTLAGRPPRASGARSETFRFAARVYAKPIVYKRDRLGNVETHFALSSRIGAGTTVAPVTTTASV